VETESGNSDIMLNALGADYTVVDGTLTIPYATKNHAGNYSCVAKVNATEVRDSVYIEVGHEAEITESLEDSKKKNTYLDINGNFFKENSHYSHRKTYCQLG
jgi:hypothetical protein